MLIIVTYIIGAFLIAVVFVLPHALLTFRRKKLQELANKYNLKFEIIRTPFFKFNFPPGRIVLQKISGNLNGHAVEITDEAMVFLFMGGWIENSWNDIWNDPFISYKRTRYVYDKGEELLKNFGGFASIKSLDSRLRKLL
ncbi:hypothetical protein HYT01_01910 [Candidatus Giovannonibacteria bacterium]|nr:hypothetical protein [Candidatus Giovannonibacteria bacterium]